MKSAIKKSLLTAFALIFALCVFVGISAHGVMATGEVNTDTFIMYDGASARPADGVNEAGMRFAAEISAEQYGNLKTAYGDNLEFGIILSTKDWIDNKGGVENFKIENSAWTEYTDGATADYYLRGRINPAADKEDLDEDGDNTEMLIMFAITDIYEYNFSRTFVAKAYYTTDGGLTYEYTDAAERSLFTVASKAIAGGRFDGNSEAETYFNSVIDTVLTTYNQVEVEVTGVDAQTEVGDKIGVTAYVSNGTKRLEAAATVTCDVDGMLTANSDGSYTINRVGDFNITAQFGDASKTVAIDNKDIKTFDLSSDITVAETDTITYQSVAETVGNRSGAYLFSSSAADKTTLAGDTIKLTNEAIKSVGSGDYLLIDVYKTKAFQLLVNFQYDDGTYGSWNTWQAQAYNGANAVVSGTGFTAAVYMANDNGMINTYSQRYLHSGYQTNTWHTLAIKLKSNPTAISLYYNYNASCTASSHIGGIRVGSVDAVYDDVVAAATIDNYAVQGDGYATAVTETNSIGGRTGVVNLTTAKVNSSGRWVVNGAQTTIPEGATISGKNFLEKMTYGMIYTFDIYVPNDNNATYTFRTQGKTGSTHATQEISSVATASGTVFEYKLLCADGTEATAGLNEYKGQWMTVHIIIVDTAGIVNSGLWCCGLYASAFADGQTSATVYVDNMKVIKTIDKFA